MKGDVMKTGKQAYYIGIGASAGGLEALEHFFKSMIDHSGLIFFVIQHLSPDYKSMMDELLARHTDMSIRVVEDGMETEINSIYLIPPRKTMTIQQGVLHLEEHEDRHSLHLPIDTFFRSLAEDQGKNSIAVILSGTGSDGTLGVRAIKEHGGMVMVQDNSAKFDGMPNSSISTGLADFILPPHKMPEELLSFIEYPSVVNKTILPKGVDTLTKVSLILKNHCGVDFSYYKENTVIRRIERRLKINRFKTIEEYILFLNESEKERDQLYRELLIGVTRFFRDEEAFEKIKEKVLPEIISKDQEEIRVWSAGCSTGEEVYSLAILMNEHMESINCNCPVKIFATDIDKEAINIASQGFYTDNIVADVPKDFLAKYFIAKEGGYQVNELIRSMIVFARHNILEDPPFSKLDLLICRNLFIYINPDKQQQIMTMFYYAIKAKGFLFLGSSESLGEVAEGYKTIDSKWKIFQPKSGYKPSDHNVYPVPRRSLFDESTTVNLGNLNNAIKMERLLTEVTSAALPPTIIVDQKNRIIQVLNDTSRIIRIRPGRFSNDLFSNINSELATFTSSIIRRLKNEDATVLSESISGIKSFENETVQIQGRKIIVDRTPLYMLSYVIEDMSSERLIAATRLNIDSESYDRIRQLEDELQLTKESLQATVEELETSNEELQSSNEELIASNEELQSTNEELQSVNEELYSVNSEHQSKIEQLTESNNDLSNLIRNTGIGALYLDSKLCIRKITPLMTQITNLMDSDVGRPIYHMTVMDNYSQMIDDINLVVDSLQSIERIIKDKDGIYWTVRIRPYRTEYNAVDGIIVTCIDVNDLKMEQQSLREVSDRLTTVMEMGNLAWWEWNVKTGEVIFDDKKATMIGYSVEEFPHEVYAICDLIHPEDYEETMQIMRDHLEGRSPCWDVTYRIKKKNGTYAWYFDRGRIIETDEKGQPLKLAGSVMDVSSLKSIEQSVLKKSKLIRSVLDDINIATCIVSENGLIEYVNKMAEPIINTQIQDEKKQYLTVENDQLIIDSHETNDKEKFLESLNKVTVLVREDKKQVYKYPIDIVPLEGLSGEPLKYLVRILEE